MPRDALTVPPRRERPQTLLARWLVAALLSKEGRTAGPDDPKTVRASREHADGAVLIRTTRDETYIVTITGPF